MKKIVYLFLFSLTSTFIYAQQNIGNLNLSNNKIAVEGYDVVAYFQDHKAIKGKEAFSVNENGVTYFFASQSHKEAFEKNSNMYKPQYGGWCAYAIGKSGEKVEVDPKTFKIINNKLYLFYNKYLTNTLKLWNKEEATLLPNADKNWKTIEKK
ncbi:YHS domain-containing (seleno)protein [Flavobacterium sp. J27]|uniref:YHS domain-containing (seleno)protein n=1 Tax=Flavobacterium sp. J27 TaxID=2060419 RepID=UPI0010321311|nr:YHS domain-containing (seleno)protein [Flavobacterium sp. J27]